MRSPKSVSGLYTLVYNKYFVDEVYDAAVVEPLIEGLATCSCGAALTPGLIDGTVNGVGPAVARHRLHPAAAAIRQYPQLRGLGGARLGACLLLAIGFAGGLR